MWAMSFSEAISSGLNPLTSRPAKGGMNFAIGGGGYAVRAPRDEEAAVRERRLARAENVPVEALGDRRVSPQINYR